MTEDLDAAGEVTMVSGQRLQRRYLLSAGDIGASFLALGAAAADAQTADTRATNLPAPSSPALRNMQWLASSSSGRFLQF